MYGFRGLTSEDVHDAAHVVHAGHRRHFHVAEATEGDDAVRVTERVASEEAEARGGAAESEAGEGQAEVAVREVQHADGRTSQSDGVRRGHVDDTEAVEGVAESTGQDGTSEGSLPGLVREGEGEASSGEEVLSHRGQLDGGDETDTEGGDGLKRGHVALDVLPHVAQAHLAGAGRGAASDAAAAGGATASRRAAARGAAARGRLAAARGAAARGRLAAAGRGLAARGAAARGRLAAAGRRLAAGGAAAAGGRSLLGREGAAALVGRTGLGRLAGSRGAARSGAAALRCGTARRLAARRAASRRCATGGRLAARGRLSLRRGTSAGCHFVHFPGLGGGAS